MLSMDWCESLGPLRTQEKLIKRPFLLDLIAQEGLGAEQETREGFLHGGGLGKMCSSHFWKGTKPCPRCFHPFSTTKQKP